jgi:hypothetical protein
MGYYWKCPHSKIHAFGDDEDPECSCQEYEEEPPLYSTTERCKCGQVHPW